MHYTRYYIKNYNLGAQRTKTERPRATNWHQTFAYLKPERHYFCTYCTNTFHLWTFNSRSAHLTENYNFFLSFKLQTTQINLISGEFINILQATRLGIIETSLHWKARSINAKAIYICGQLQPGSTLSLWRRANARNVSFLNSFAVVIQPTRLIKPNFCCHTLLLPFPTKRTSIRQFNNHMHASRAYSLRRTRR